MSTLKCRGRKSDGDRGETSPCGEDAINQDPSNPMCFECLEGWLLKHDATYADALQMANLYQANREFRNAEAAKRSDEKISQMRTAARNDANLAWVRHQDATSAAPQWLVDLLVAERTRPEAQ